MSGEWGKGELPGRIQLRGLEFPHGLGSVAVPRFAFVEIWGAVYKIL